MKILLLIKGVAARVVVGISGILVARILSKDDYGLVISVASIAALFLTISRLGLNEYTIVKSAKSNIQSLKSSYIESMDRLQNATALILTIPGILLSVFLLKKNPPVFVCTIFLLVYARGYIDSIRVGTIGATLQTNGNNQKFIDSQLIFSLSAITSLLLLYFLELEITGYLLAAFLGSVVFYLIGTFKYKKEINNKTIAWPHLPSTKEYGRGTNAAIRVNTSYFFSEIMAFAYIQGSAIVLVGVTNSAEVARYAVVASLITAGYIVPGVIYQWTLPLLAETASNHRNFINTLKRSSFQIMVLTTPAALILAIFSSQIIQLLLGPKYASSASVLIVMAAVFLIHSLCFVPAAALTSLGQQNSRVRLQMISATIGIGTTATLGSTMGGIAAAYGCLAAEIFLAIGYITTTIKAVQTTNWTKL